MYHLQLTGEVGSSTFNAMTVRKVLAQYPGKHVDILIDSFGGSLAEGLSICGAIRDHGDVTVHFRGMNASAATLASMGAKKISIAPESFYLVHKVSMTFLDWASRNADELEDFIQALQSTKEDLDTMDRNIAQLYASRCKRPVKDLLNLMKQEKWISAEDAKGWGFVDEICTDSGSGKSTPTITKAQAAAFRNSGVPLPPVAVVDDEPTDEEKERRSIVATLTDIFKNLLNMSKESKETKEKTLTENVVQAPVHESQEQNSDGGETSAKSAEEYQNEIDELKAEVARLKSTTPGATTKNVVATPKSTGEEKPVNDYSEFMKAGVNAKKLFDSIP